MANKLIAILGGGDWYDASVEFLVIDDGVDTKQERERYELWNEERYKRKAWGEYKSFAKWLLDNGLAREAGDSDIEVISDD